MIPMYPEDEICLLCRKACMDKYEEHALHCKELPGFKYRHDLVWDVLWDIPRRAGISAKKEIPVNFLKDPMEGRSTLRPADLFVFGWAGGNMLVWTLRGFPFGWFKGKRVCSWTSSKKGRIKESG
ncbi:putative exostosin [Helianthus annuus]|nr:putative exostosin [Helianthus annuus]